MAKKLQIRMTGQLAPSRHCVKCESNTWIMSSSRLEVMDWKNLLFLLNKLSTDTLVIEEFSVQEHGHLPRSALDTALQSHALAPRSFP